MNLSQYLGDPGERPLERLVDDGGFTSIFRTIGCIGDSLSSGEFEATDEEGQNKTYHDDYEYSWGQYMARAAGNKVYNFSRGGMTAKEFWESFADEIDCWHPDKLCQAYILALGVNDLYGIGMEWGLELGSLDDVDLENYENNKDTFCGYLARIIQKLKQLQPEARIFLMTMPRGQLSDQDAKVHQHADLMHELAACFTCTYVLDLRRYAPVYDEAFKRSFYLGGHMNPMGYVLTAKMVMSYIDYIVRHNMEDFAQVGFIGKGLRYYPEQHQTEG